MNQLVVLGSVNIDHVIKVPSFPRPGETIHGRDYYLTRGGKGANQAISAGRLGADVGFMACVGEDAFGIECLERFKEDGINVSEVKVIPEISTGLAFIQVNDNGENTICISAGANAMLNAEFINRASLRIAKADYLLLQLETNLDGIEKAIQIAKHHQTRIILNPAPAKELSDDLLSCVDIITPNETEVECLTGIQVHNDLSAQRACDVLHQKGIDTVIITLGKQGVWLSNRENQQRLPGFNVKALDTTAAGDTFNGALVTALLEKNGLISAIRFAHAAAAISVTRLGAQSSIPVRREVDAFLSKQASLQ